MRKTQRDCIIAAIEQDGWVLDKHAKSTRFIVYRRPRSPVRVYLGIAGAVRYSPKGPVGKSFPITDTLRKSLLKRGQAVFASAPQKALDKFMAV